MFVITVQYAAGDHFSNVYRGTVIVTLIYSALFGWHILGCGFNI